MLRNNKFGTARGPNYVSGNESYYAWFVDQRDKRQRVPGLFKTRYDALIAARESFDTCHSQVDIAAVFLSLPVPSSGPGQDRQETARLGSAQ